MSQIPELSNPANKLYFYVGIMDNYDGRKLRKLTPNADGYYEGVPLSAFNAKSLNGCYYDTESYHRQLTDKASVFNMKLTHGNMFGEWGHPKDELNLKRICTVDRDQQSHHFSAIYTDKTSTNNVPIIYGDLKPSGPKGRWVQESLDNPRENTSFSLRCLMTEKFDRSLNAPVRTVEEFITFDAVDMPGYLYGSKWYASDTSVGKEWLLPVTMDMLFDHNGNRVALESFSDKRVLELFGVENFTLGSESLGSYFKGTNTYRDPYGINRSVTHQALARR